MAQSCPQKKKKTGLASRNIVFKYNNTLYQPCSSLWTSHRHLKVVSFKGRKKARVTPRLVSFAVKLRVLDDHPPPLPPPSPRARHCTTTCSNINGANQATSKLSLVSRVRSAYVTQVAGERA